MKEKEFLQQEPGGKRSLYLVICVLRFLQETGDQNTNKWEKIFPSSLQASVPNIPQPLCEVLMDLGYMDMQKKKKIVVQLMSAKRAQIRFVSSLSRNITL